MFLTPQEWAEFLHLKRSLLLVCTWQLKLRDTLFVVIVLLFDKEMLQNIHMVSKIKIYKAVYFIYFLQIYETQI